jgi:hypothetical protein
MRRQPSCHWTGGEDHRRGRDISETREVNRATFEQASVGIAHVGTDGRWLRVNDKSATSWATPATNSWGDLPGGRSGGPRGEPGRCSADSGRPDDVVLLDKRTSARTAPYSLHADRVARLDNRRSKNINDNAGHHQPQGGRADLARPTLTCSGCAEQPERESLLRRSASVLKSWRSSSAEPGDPPRHGNREGRWHGFDGAAA